MLLLFSCWVVSKSFVTLWAIACQAPLSMGFPRQEHWNELPFPSPGDLSNLGTEPYSLSLSQQGSAFHICKMLGQSQNLETVLVIIVKEYSQINILLALIKFMKYSLYSFPSHGVHLERWNYESESLSVLSDSLRPMDCSLPSSYSSAYGILQARIWEWIAILFSRGSS